jgi:hypothetical protein
MAFFSFGNSFGPAQGKAAAGGCARTFHAQDFLTKNDERKGLRGIAQNSAALAYDLRSAGRAPQISSNRHKAVTELKCARFILHGVREKSTRTTIFNERK